MTRYETNVTNEAGCPRTWTPQGRTDALLGHDSCIRRRLLLLALKGSAAVRVLERIGFRLSRSTSFAYAFRPKNLRLCLGLLMAKGTRNGFFTNPSTRESCS